MKEVLHKEIDLIQSCISRMAQNSFTIKGLSLTSMSIVGALLLGNYWYIKICILVTVIGFWYLDAYYLHLERSYRALYNWVIDSRQNGNMEHLYDLDYKRFEKQVLSIFQCARRRHNLIFYGILVTSILVFAFITP